MGLLSIFKRKTDAPSGAPAARTAPGGVQQARTRARRRLVGAAVLVVIGVIAFPLVFESQPRPIAVDIPIEIPRKDGAPALVMPSARPALPAPESAASSATSTAKTIVEPVMPEVGAAPERGPAASAAGPSPASPVTPLAPVAPAPQPPTPKAVAPEPVEAPKKASAPTATAPPAAAPAAADAAKARALLEGKPIATKEAARFVVQVGAFAEAAAAQDTRAKLEKLGLKSFTQVTETAAGNRTRVRLGPFSTREEAERVLAKAKAAGVNGVVLTL